MSRVAKKPVVLPKGVDVQITAEAITVKGPKGSLTLATPPGVIARLEDGQVLLSGKAADDVKMAGTARALINNMVVGVSEGYQRKLELVGVGYRAALAGKDLNLTLGFSHPVVFKAPEGVTLEVPTQTEILILEGSQEGLRHFSFSEKDSGQEHRKTSPRQIDAYAHPFAWRSAPQRASHRPASLRTGFQCVGRQGTGYRVNRAEGGC